MGLFDNLVKKVIDNTIGQEKANELGTKLKEYTKENFTTNLKSTKEIPSEYSHFPTFDHAIDTISTKNESKYKRCTMNFYNVKLDEVNAYIEKILSLGYKKETDVRFEKDNEYIIVDYNKEPELNLVFHVRF